MALYARRFGIRDFSNIVRNGRHVANVDLLIGGAVKVDTSTDKVVAAGASDTPGALSGIAVYEHYFAPDITTLTTSDDMATAPSGKYVQVVNGQGVKVFFVNNGARTYGSGATQAAITVVTGTITAGNGLKPSATPGQWVAATATATDWMTIESVTGSTANGGQQTVEARLLF